MVFVEGREACGITAPGCPSAEGGPRVRCGTQWVGHVRNQRVAGVVFAGDAKRVGMPPPAVRPKGPRGTDVRRRIACTKTAVATTTAFAEVTETEHLYADTWITWFRSPDIGNGAYPGQFLMLRCSDEVTDIDAPTTTYLQPTTYDPLLPRPMSFHRVAPVPAGRVGDLSTTSSAGGRRGCRGASRATVCTAGVPSGAGTRSAARPQPAAGRRRHRRRAARVAGRRGGREGIERHDDRRRAGRRARLPVGVPAAGSGRSSSPPTTARPAAAAS